MIQDHRPDTLTPMLRRCQSFDAAVPVLLEAAHTADPRLALLARQAVRELHGYDFPIGRRLDRAWLFLFQQKLDTPNRFSAHWSLQSGSRDRWAKQMQAAVAQAMGVASWANVVTLGRAPVCTVPMRLSVIRLVASSREFIRDDDNLAFSRKHLQDCLKPLGLVKDDRREWLTASVIQDVAPTGFPITVCLLCPAVAGLAFSEESSCSVTRSRSTTPAAATKPKRTTR